MTAAEGRAPAPVASLPMYDWPEVREATDALWAALRDALRARGIAAPWALSRGLGTAAWDDPGLALSQTCGLPYRTRLRARVTLVGAFDHGLAGCPPGFYRSAIVARADDGRTVAELAAARVACNASDSQSGWAALVEALGPLDAGRCLETGAHRASVAAVAEGRADVAAIDAVCWRLAQDWEPAAAGLRVAAWTRPTPGLPLIAAAGVDPAPRAAAVAAALATLAPEARATLGIVGFVALRPEDYG